MSHINIGKLFNTSHGRFHHKKVSKKRIHYSGVRDNRRQYAKLNEVKNCNQSWFCEPKQNQTWFLEHISKINTSLSNLI